jgi:hypothetical protein
MYKIISWFIIKAIIFYTVLIVAWSFCVGSYVNIIMPVANKELQIIGVGNITKLGPSLDPKFEVAVYHRDAAAMQDSLFDFKLESLRSHIPMFLALTLAIPYSFTRRLKAAVIGLFILLAIDSLICVIIMTWSYTFLPDQHVFTPFSASPIRDSIINFLYNFYNAIGVGFIPIIVWVLVGVRKKDIERWWKRKSIV